MTLSKTEKNFTDKYKDKCYKLLENKIITRDDGEVFNEVVSYAISKGNGFKCYDLLEAEIITRNDGELFNKIVECVVNNSSSYECWRLIQKDIVRSYCDSILYNKVVDRIINLGVNEYIHRILDDHYLDANGELLNKAINKIIDSGSIQYIYKLFYDKIILYGKKELFNKAIDICCKNINEDNSKEYLLLIRWGIINENNGESFNKVVLEVSKYGECGSYLLDHKFITRKNIDLYNKVINTIIDNCKDFCILDLITKKFITKEDGELFNKAINAIADTISKGDSDYYLGLLLNFIKDDIELFNKTIEYSINIGRCYPIYSLIYEQFITKDNRELFYKAINKILDSNKSSISCYLLEYEFITRRRDEELFRKAVNKILDYDYKSAENTRFLLRHKIIDTDADLFNKAINKVIDTDEYNYIFYLLYDKIITKDDSELFNKIVNILMNSKSYSCQLLTCRVITKKDGEYFYKIINHIIDHCYPGDSYSLIEYKVITPDDKELYTKALSRWKNVSTEG